MGSWRARASVASITGACLFAVTTGAGAVFVGDWWGQNHGSVVTVYVTTTASAPGTRPPAVAVHPGRGHSRARASASEAAHDAADAADADAQADAGSAQVARVTPAASHHRSKPAPPAPASPFATTVEPGTAPPSLGGSPEPTGTDGEPAPVVVPTPGITHSPGRPSR